MPNYLYFIRLCGQSLVCIGIKQIFQIKLSYLTIILLPTVPQNKAINYTSIEGTVNEKWVPQDLKNLFIGLEKYNSLLCPHLQQYS